MKVIKLVVVALATVLGFSVISASSASAAGPEVTITKLSLDGKGRPVIKVATNMAAAVLIALPNSDGEPVTKKPGTKTYRIKSRIAKGNSATWSVVVYDLNNGEIADSATYTWRNWKKLAGKCDRSDPVIVVKAKKAKAGFIKASSKKGDVIRVKLIKVAQEGREHAFGVANLPKGYKAIGMAAGGATGYKSIKCLK